MVGKGIYRVIEKIFSRGGKLQPVSSRYSELLGEETISDFHLYFPFEKMGHKTKELLNILLISSCPLKKKTRDTVLE